MLTCLARLLLCCGSKLDKSRAGSSRSAAVVLFGGSGGGGIEAAISLGRGACRLRLGRLAFSSCTIADGNSANTVGSTWHKIGWFVRKAPVRIINVVERNDLPVRTSARPPYHLQ